MSRVVDTQNAKHYRWGDASDGWHLVEREDLSVIQERVPAGGKETRHVHSRSRQFFYMLEGRAVLEVGEAEFELAAGQGLEVAPGVAHQLRNESSEPVRFLVVSAPRSHGDRADLE